MTTTNNSLDRQIILDTETTGLSYEKGDRLIEIGCLEMIDRRLTGEIFHCYLQPDKEVDPDAFRVHGISNEALKGQPRFKSVAQSFLDFVSGAELIIHNAPFDVGFLDNELALLDGNVPQLSAVATITDTLVMARKLHPGSRHNLDALVKRYNIKTGDRTLHGAVIDCEILASVYLAMTGGQKDLTLEADKPKKSAGLINLSTATTTTSKFPDLPVILASESELAAHQQICDAIGCDFTVTA